MRKENPSGLLYELSNGQMWEGKDLELVSSVTFDEPVSKKSSLPSSFSEYDIETDNIIILRVKQEPNISDNPMPPMPPSDEEQEVPKNVKDPFEKENQKDKDGQDKEGEGKDGEGKDGEGKDGEGKDGEGKDGEGEDGEGKDGDGEDGEGEDGEGKDGEGKDGEGKDGERKDGEGKDGEGKDGEGKDGEGEGDFGGTGDDEIDFEELMKKVAEDFKQGKSGQQIQTESDIKEVEFALSTKADKIKEIFKNKQLAKAGIGGRQIFATDNEKRINDVLNEIFK
jgi:hypothetical protein